MKQEKDRHGCADRDAGQECDDKASTQVTTLPVIVAAGWLNRVQPPCQIIQKLLIVTKWRIIISEKVFEIGVFFHRFNSLRNCSRPRESRFLTAIGEEPMIRDISRTE